MGHKSRFINDIVVCWGNDKKLPVTFLHCFMQYNLKLVDLNGQMYITMNFGNDNPMVEHNIL